mgnify:FL=1|jgi:hypothetical protein
MTSTSENASATFTARAFGAAGAVSFALAVRFWRARKTMPFKVAAASTWLTAGPAAVLWYAPRREEAETVLRERARERGSGARDAEIRASGVAAARAIIGRGDESGGG